jgi:hypothetical protein
LPLPSTTRLFDLLVQLGFRDGHQGAHVALEAGEGGLGRSVAGPLLWVADIGFCVRKEAWSGGPPITKALMRMCLEANLEIWLSEYGNGKD